MSREIPQAVIRNTEQGMEKMRVDLCSMLDQHTVTEDRLQILRENIKEKIRDIHEICEFLDEHRPISTESDGERSWLEEIGMPTIPERFE